MCLALGLGMHADRQQRFWVCRSLLLIYQCQEPHVHELLVARAATECASPLAWACMQTGSNDFGYAGHYYLFTNARNHMSTSYSWQGRLRNVPRPWLGHACRQAATILGMQVITTYLPMPGTTCPRATLPCCPGGGGGGGGVSERASALGSGMRLCYEGFRSNSMLIFSTQVTTRLRMP